MPEPNLELLCAQVEVALEEGDLRTARRMLEENRSRFGEAPELQSLAAQIEEVAKLAGRSTLEGLVQQAQEHVRTADYPGAIELLRRADALYPGNAELQAALERTEKAAERHAGAVERRQGMAKAVKEVSALLDMGDLQTARQRLQTARGQFGRQKAFDELEARLHVLVEKAQSKSADQHLARARGAAEQADWHGALNQAELALTLAPGHSGAMALQQQARAALTQAANVEQRQSSLGEAEADIRRLIGADELPRAAQRLQEAVDALGREPLFEELAAAIDKAKKDRDFKRRFEWRERRAKEAEALVQEATRRALGGDFKGAVERLETAKELDPSFPDLDAKLETHRTALERHRQEEKAAAALEQTLATIRSHLDSLHLGEAAALIKKAAPQLAEDARFVRLVKRLEGLREAEDQAQALPTPENLSTLGLAARGAIRQHEKTVAAAYSWRQAFSFPGRDSGPLLVIGLSLVLGAGHFSAAALGLPSLISLLLALILVPSLVRSGLEGNNHVPRIADLWRPRTVLADAAQGLLIFAVAAAPAVAWILSRDSHGFFARGPLGFFILALLLWAASWWIGGAMGVVMAFGPRRLIPPYRLALPGATLLAISAAIFTVLAAAIWLHVAVVPVMGIPLAALVEAYGLVSLPHLIGVMVRGRRLDWAIRYAGS